MISVAPIATTSWVCDTRLVSYAMEQAERLISHARANKVVHNFAWTRLYNNPNTTTTNHNFSKVQYRRYFKVKLLLDGGWGGGEGDSGTPLTLF